MADDVILLGTRKGLITFGRKGGDWRLTDEHFLGVHVSFAAVDARTGVWWACLDHGHWGVKLHRSRDKGATWEEIDAPTFPEGATIREGKPAVVSYLWVLASGGLDQPERLYIGTVPGGLFVSDDGGNTWALSEKLWQHPTRDVWFGGGMDEAGIHSVVVDPRDSRRVRLGISAAGVFETIDDGQTWSPQNRGCRADFLPNPDAEVGHDPHLLVACQSAPDVLWQQNHCGVFRSSDGAREWTDISDAEGPAGFGFAVASDPEDADVAWVIPAVSDERRVAVDRALCVCRTDDGGARWTAFRSGLPQADCYDFAFRHGLDLRGDRLAFGTACGSAYVSDDRGELWQRLATDLPPVYSVRFA